MPIAFLFAPLAVFGILAEPGLAVQSDSVVADAAAVASTVANPPIEWAYTPAPAELVEPEWVEPIGAAPQLNSPLAQSPSAPPTNPQLPNPQTPSSPAPTPPADPLQTSADRQEYDTTRQVFTAIGNVLLQFRQAQLQADQVETNLQTQVVAAAGNVKLTRGEQILQGQELAYNLLTDRGSFIQVSGTINLARIGSDLNADRGLTTNVSPNSLNPLTDQIPTSPTDRIKGLSNSLSPARGSGVQRLRFTADRIDFDAGRWVARNIRITNDPFDPPELELKAEQASFVRLSATDDLVAVRRGRIVFDQRVSIPLLRDRLVLSRRRRDILPFSFGYDNDRGGLFIGRSLELVDTPRTSLVATPQFFLQRATGRSFDLSNLDLYGGTLQLSHQFNPTLNLLTFTRFTSLDPQELEDNTRANLRLEQALGRNRLALEGSLRDRLFNGSLGEQNVRSSVGLVFDGAPITLGTTGIDFSYQVSTRFITADTQEVNEDEGEEGNRTSRPISLVRLQGAASLSRGFILWRGDTLPPTATEGLRYTPTPVQPYLKLFTGLLAVSSNYSNGETQQVFEGSVGLEGQLGRFSRSFLDSTSFRISYSQLGNFGLSPFLFDRVVDSKVLSFGFMQQVYGPLRAGVQSSFNLDSGEVFNTDILVEYSRRTYGVILRYSPDRQAGSFQIRINGFNWRGNPDPLVSPEVGTVEGGVTRPPR